MKKILETSPYALPGIPKLKDPTLEELFEKFLQIVIERYKYVDRPFGRDYKAGKPEITFLSPETIIRRDNNQGMVYIRQLFYYYVRKKNSTLYSLKILGKLFKQDHTTVMAGVVRYTQLLETNSKLPIALEHMNLKTRKDYEEVIKLMNQ